MLYESSSNSYSLSIYKTLAASCTCMMEPLVAHFVHNSILVLEIIGQVLSWPWSYEVISRRLWRWGKRSIASDAPGKLERRCICGNEQKSWGSTLYCLDTCWDCLHVFFSLLARVFDNVRETKELLALCQPRTSQGGKNYLEICLQNIIFLTWLFFRCTK